MKFIPFKEQIPEDLVELIIVNLNIQPTPAFASGYFEQGSLILREIDGYEYLNNEYFDYNWAYADPNFIEQ